MEPSRQTWTVECDVDAVRLEVGVGGSNGGKDTSPVGILAEDSALEEVAAAIARPTCTASSSDVA